MCGVLQSWSSTETLIGEPIVVFNDLQPRPPTAPWELRFLMCAAEKDSCVCLSTGFRSACSRLKQIEESRGGCSWLAGHPAVSTDSIDWMISVYSVSWDASTLWCKPPHTHWDSHCVSLLNPPWITSSIKTADCWGRGLWQQWLSPQGLCLGTGRRLVQV